MSIPLATTHSSVLIRPAQFFKELLSEEMVNVAKASKSSQVVFILDKRYYDLEPQPLHRLNFYIQQCAILSFEALIRADSNLVKACLHSASCGNHWRM